RPWSEARGADGGTFTRCGRAVPESLSQRLALAAESRAPWPDHPIAVALVITDLDVGGAERALAALATRLPRSRWQPKVLCLGPRGAIVGVLHNAQVPCECLGARRGHPLQAVARLARRPRVSAAARSEFHVSRKHCDAPCSASGGTAVGDRRLTGGR